MMVLANPTIATPQQTGYRHDEVVHESPDRDAPCGPRAVLAGLLKWTRYDYRKEVGDCLDPRW
jgi:hypothetical protein